MSHFLVAGVALALEGLRARLLVLAAPAREHVPADTQVVSDLCDRYVLALAQLDRLALVLDGILRSFFHDTPPGPHWALTDVSVPMGENPSIHSRTEKTAGILKVVSGAHGEMPSGMQAKALLEPVARLDV